VVGESEIYCPNVKIRSRKKHYWLEAKPEGISKIIF